MVHRTTAPKAGDLKEDVFSFTHEVLRAWQPGELENTEKHPVMVASNSTPDQILGLAASTKFKLSSHTQTDEKSAVNDAIKHLRLNTSSPTDRSKAQPSASNGTSMLDSLALKVQELPSHAQKVFTSAQHIVVIGFAFAATVLGICCLVAYWDVDNCADNGKDNACVDEDAQVPSKTHLELLAAVKSGDGTWAQNYKDAEVPRQMALELLFRCNIIKAEEFSNSRVNQEHVDECVWIATHMLRKRSLEDWAAHGVPARSTFEESVTACYKERTSISSQRNDSASLSARHSVTRQRSQDEAVLSRDSWGQNLLVKRCREIMTSPGGRASVSSAPQTSNPAGQTSEARFSAMPNTAPRTKAANLLCTF